MKLIKASLEYKSQITEMIKEWKEDIDRNKTNSSPYAIFKNPVDDFSYYLDNLELKEDKDGYVKDSTFFLYEENEDKILGAINIRHHLSERIILEGGHIGYGIRPSCRKKGYATKMLSLALEECKKLDINKVLITCDSSNIGSRKTILNNNGIYESSVIEKDNIVERYFINLKEEWVYSKRLKLRRAMAYDYEDMFSFLGDERVYKYLLNKPVQHPKDAIKFLRLNDPNSTSKYIMLVIRKEDDHVIGVVSLAKNLEYDAYELSYSINYDDWNKGYTTEASKAMMEYVESKNGHVRFISEAAKENKGSIKVLEKLGFVHYKDSTYTKRDGSVTFDSEIFIKE